MFCWYTGGGGWLGSAGLKGVCDRMEEGGGRVAACLGGYPARAVALFVDITDGARGTGSGNSRGGEGSCRVTEFSPMFIEERAFVRLAAGS